MQVILRYFEIFGSPFFYITIYVRGRVQTTWTNKGEGGCSDQLFSKSVHIGGGGVKIAQNSVHVVCTRPLTNLFFDDLIKNQIGEYVSLYTPFGK